MATTVNKPVAIQLTNGQTLATPDPDVDGTQVLQNNGTNRPKWVAAGSTTAVQLLVADPATPVDDTVWFVREGNSPSQTVAVRARISGTTVTIASITR